MSRGALIRLFREWAALLAVLAMSLGPLGLSVGRGLAAQEKIAIAAGLVAPAICQTSDELGGGTRHPLTACDHCLPALGAAPPCPAPITLHLLFAARTNPADTAPSALLAQLRLPPATGPPQA